MIRAREAAVISFGGGVMTGKFRFGAVIPAAGLSSRMGGFKPLMPFAGQTIIESSVGSAMPYAATAAAVVGYRGGEVAEVLRRRFGSRLAIVENPDFSSTDMLRSVQLGLRAMGECDAFFLLPADMPLISPKVYEKLIAAFDDSVDVIYPAFGGRRGHPPLIHARLIPKILGYEGEGGLRAILGNCTAKEIEIPDRGILADLDTPQDYAALNSGKTEPA